MLHIVLLILKIIGIILLCILGILLLAVLGVLFVPVRYKIELSREEGEGKPPFVARAKITWLLHAANIFIRYPAEKAYVRVRLFIFTLFMLPEKQTNDSARSKRHKKTKQNKKEEQNEGIREQASDKQPQSEERSKDPDTAERNIKQNPEQEAGQDAVQRSKRQTTVSSEGDKELPTVTISAQKRTKQKTKNKKLHKILKMIKNVFHKIRDLFQNIQYTIKNFCDKIKSVSEQIEYYRKLIASDVFQQSFQLCKGELAYIFKKLKPQKIEADLIIGTNDPAVTGEILAIYGMLYPFIGEHMNVAGDFEQQRIEGHVFIKGRIRAVTFVKTAIRIYFNKDVRKLINLLKKEAV